jgi:hypothetical protein
MSAECHRHLSKSPAVKSAPSPAAVPMEEEGGFRGMPAVLLKAFKYRRFIGHVEDEKSVERFDGMRLRKTI